MARKKQKQNKSRLTVGKLLPLLTVSLLLNAYLLSQESSTENALTETHHVKDVVDGDTFIVEDGNVRMRLMHVESPELEFCGGMEAKQALSRLIKGKRVKIVTTAEDVFNRSLVLVYLGNKLINKELVSGGYVRYDGSPSTERDNVRDAYQQAVRKKRGIFGPPCRSEKPDKPSCVIKGNIQRSSRGGGKIYHLSGCSEYSRTIIEKDLGEQWFCTEKEAIEAGFAKAKNC